MTRQLQRPERASLQVVRSSLSSGHEPRTPLGLDASGGLRALPARYCVRYVVSPGLLSALAIAALALSLTPIAQANYLTIGASLEYVALWALVVAEALLVILGARARTKRLPPGLLDWRPGTPKRALLTGYSLWRLFGWVALISVLVNVYLILDLNGGFPLF